LSLFFKNEYPTHPNTDQELHSIILGHGFDPKPSHITCFEALRTKVEDEVSRLNAANSVSLKMTLSDDLLRQIATFSKALSRNKSHLLVSSPSGYHRYCTFRLISSMMRHTFWEFDAKLQSRDVLNEIIGRIYLTVGGEQDKALMVVKIDLLKPWDSDVCAMLSHLHCLISTGDPGNTVSAEERRKVMEIAVKVHALVRHPAVKRKTVRIERVDVEHRHASLPGLGAPCGIGQGVHLHPAAAIALHAVASAADNEQMGAVGRAIEHHIHGQRLALIMRDVNESDPSAPLDLAQLGAHMLAQFQIKR
jgi:hypothetical protein